MPNLHTRQFPAGRFVAHGEIEVSLTDQVLRWKAVGPFNREAFDSMTIMMQELLTSTEPSTILATITTVHGSIMMSDEALTGFGEYLGRARGFGLRPIITAYAVAFDVEGRNLIIPRLERLYKENHRNLGVFERTDEAEAWVAQQLALHATRVSG
jgi:hypothetical protein